MELKAVESKYLDLHRITIAAFLYLILLFITKLGNFNKFIFFIYPIVLILYLKFSNRIDSIIYSIDHIRSSEIFYLLMWIISATIILAVRPGREGTFVKKVVVEFFGYNGIIISIFLFISSSIMGFEIYKKKNKV